MKGFDIGHHKSAHNLHGTYFFVPKGPDLGAEMKISKKVYGHTAFGYKKLLSILSDVQKSPVTSLTYIFTNA